MAPRFPVVFLLYCAETGAWMLRRPGVAEDWWRMPDKIRHPRRWKDLPEWARRPHAGTDVLDPWSPFYVEPAKRYNLLKKKNVLLCSCDKCGTTSLYDYVYQALYNTSWPYTNEPWEQDLYTNRWGGHFRLIEKEELSNVTYKFALIRDPIERLISAWKSKFACDEYVGAERADDSDRRRMVPELYMLAGQKSDNYCLWIDEFAQLLQIVHRGGNAARLDSHIRPQQFGCFRDVEAKRWTKIAPITDRSFAKELGPVIGAPSGLVIPHIHSSPKWTSKDDALELTPETKAILNEVTREEYEALGLQQH